MDAGRDGTGLDAGVRIRFAHGLVNLGPLTVCHDPDGPGPLPAYVLSEAGQRLRADFGKESPSIIVPRIGTGSLTLQRDATRPAGDAGLDAGTSARDGGASEFDCSESTREATIPLPIQGSWLDPQRPLEDDDLAALDLATVLAGGPSLTLLGSGLALDPRALDERAAAARSAALAQNAGDTKLADAAGELERAALEAAFGARALIQRDAIAESAQSFALSVFHAIADVAPADVTQAAQGVGAVRVCITAGTRESSAFPAPPEPGIAFRMRARVGSFDPRLDYTFRVFAERDLAGASCATANLTPLVERKITRDEQRFSPGAAYTLALVGAQRPSSLCSPGDASIVRAGCALPATSLVPRIVVLESESSPSATGL